MSREDKGLLDAIQLRAVFLDECSVKRGNPEHMTPGTLTSSTNIQHSREEEQVVVYTAKSLNRFHNNDEQLIAEIEVSFAVVYDLREYDPSDTEIDRFAKDWVVVHVMPFLREFLATMTNRMGMAPFYLPLYKVEPEMEPSAG